MQRRRYATVRASVVPTKAWEDDDGYPSLGGRTDCIVHEMEDGWVPTGLLGPDGQAISYWEGKEPIGFLWHTPEGELLPRDEVIEKFYS